MTRSFCSSCGARLVQVAHRSGYDAWTGRRRWWVSMRCPNATQRTMLTDDGHDSTFGKAVTEL